MSSLKMEVPPADLYLSIQGIQYAFHEAIADLVDNAIDADATRIWIDADKQEIVIADDGVGMTTEELEVAITPWRAARERQKMRRGKRGKFGIGLKSASFSLGDCLEIHTATSLRAFEFICLDRAEIAKLKKLGHEFTTENQPTAVFKSYCKNGHGTVLKITKVNRRKVVSQALESLRNLLGLVYFSLIENGEIKIMINNQEVKAIEPLMRGLKKNHSKNRYELFEKQTIVVDYEDKRATFRIQGAYVGRGEFWTEEDKKNYKYFLKRSGAESDTASKSRLKLDEQGIYTLRNGRLITLGGWLGLASQNTLLHHNASTRVLLEFDEAGDELMGLDNTKTLLKIEELLKDRLASVVRDIVNRGEKLFRRDGDDLKVLERRENSSAEIKNLNLRKDVAVAQYRMEEKRRKSIPEYDDRQAQIEMAQALEAIALEEVVDLKEKLPYNNLWDWKQNKDGDVMLLMNEQHPGYAALFLEEDDVKRRKNLNHFLYTLVLHEASIAELHSELKPALREELEKAFKTFRRWVSKHYTEF